MQIHSFVAKTEDSLNFEAVHFTSPTLLVGLSGAGKSQLLSYLFETFQIMCGKESPSLPSGTYTLDFEFEGDEYQFLTTVHAGEVRLKKLLSDSENPVISLLNVTELKQYLIQIKNIVAFRQAAGDFCQHINDEQKREEIRQLYHFIFDEMDDIEFSSMRFRESEGEWIDVNEMSDGMIKTFSYLAELIMAPEGSVFLIDEFENGLGLNCLNVLLEEMLEREDIQLIMSSHHPYIINNIPSQCWQVITREKNNIFATSAEQLGIGLTRYDAFFELMNRFYQGGE